MSPLSSMGRFRSLAQCIQCMYLRISPTLHWCTLFCNNLVSLAVWALCVAPLNEVALRRPDGLTSCLSCLSPWTLQICCKSHCKSLRQLSLWHPSEYVAAAREGGGASATKARGSRETFKCGRGPELRERCSLRTTRRADSQWSPHRA